MWLAQSHCLAMCRLWWMHVVVIVLFWRQSCTHCSQRVCGMGLCFQGNISCVESLAVHRDMADSPSQVTELVAYSVVC
jgi:hypothetical protein